MSPNLCHIKFDKKHKNLVYLPPLQYINYVLNNQKIFKNMEVVSIKTISHDTKLIILKYCDKIINVIPPGHHIYIKSEKGKQVFDRIFSYSIHFRYIFYTSGSCGTREITSGTYS